MEGQALHISPKPSVEKAIIAQVVSAVEPQYLAAVHNLQTGRYGSNVLAVLHHLFKIYGHITPKQLKTREMEICNMHFHMELPVDAIFNAIDELMEPDEYALMPMSSTQAVRSWNRFSAEHCKWENKKCTSERRKRTVHLFLLQCRSTPKRISLSLVELVPTCHPLMIINPPL